jgi:hypothetical protein
MSVELHNSGFLAGVPKFLFKVPPSLSAVLGRQSRWSALSFAVPVSQVRLRHRVVQNWQNLLKDRAPLHRDGRTPAAF